MTIQGWEEDSLGPLENIMILKGKLCDEVFNRRDWGTMQRPNPISNLGGHSRLLQGTAARNDYNMARYAILFFILILISFPPYDRLVVYRRWHALKAAGK